jgi:hypothetical protein
VSPSALPSAAATPTPPFNAACAVSTLAGSGTQASTDGTGAGAAFNGPTGVAYSPARGAFYVGTAAFTALATITMWRHSGLKRGAAEAGVVVLAALGPLLFAISGDTFDITAGTAWQAVMLGLLGLGLLSLAVHALKTPTFMLKGIVLAIAIALARK